MNALRRAVAGLTLWGAIAGALVVLGGTAALQRFHDGLGATTNLSDRFPWGFWIGFDFLGIGMAAAGFTIVATVHLLHMERFEPIVRPALLTAFLGYLLVVLVLIVDLGRWDRFWHPLVMWNPHSVMFEITWCVILYTTVLLLEFAPIVLERAGFTAPLRALRTIALPVMVTGVILSTLHQSSFGSLYLAVPGRLHPLWYTPLLPFLFFVSCLAAGLSMVIFESRLLARNGYRLPARLVADLGKVVAVILALYGTLRVQDLLARQVLGRAFEWTYQAGLFWLEVGLGIAVPLGLLLVRRWRESERGAFVASVLVLLGFAANRMNTVVTGLESWPDATYLPSPQEFLIGLGIGALGFVAFAALARVLPILPARLSVRPEAQDASPRPQTAVHPAYVGALVIAVGLSAMAAETARKNAPRPATPEAAPLRASETFRMPADVVFSQGSDSPGPVTFRHASHVDPERPECGSCHAARFALLAPARAPLIAAHGAARCGACHNGRDATDIQEDCEKCHRTP